MKDLIEYVLNKIRCELLYDTSIFISGKMLIMNFELICRYFSILLASMISEIVYFLSLPRKFVESQII